jgi:Tfp pilus assembly protein PilF
MIDSSNKRDCRSPVGGGAAAGRKNKLIELQRSATIAYAAGRYQDSARLIRQALALRPNIAEAHNDLGASLAALGQNDEAIAEYREAVRLKPRFHQARCNLAGALLNRGDMHAAMIECDRALRDGPGYPEGHNVMGTILLERREIRRACQSFREAILLKPDHIEAHANLGVALLTLGDFAGGWREYEWRRKRPGWVRPGQAWDGSDPFGKTLLLWAEGGLGNAIQFIRYAAVLRDLGAQVVLEVHPALKPLLRDVKGIWKIAGRGEAMPHYDLHCPLTSVAAILRTDAKSIPATIPYLTAEPELVEQWREKLAGIAGLKVGIVWEAEQRTAYGRRRSIPLEHYRALASVPGVSLISLQKEWKGPADLAVKVLDGLDEARGAFMDTAAIMQCLDLVITADTSTAHLAGALGVAVWVAIPMYRTGAG